MKAGDEPNGFAEDHEHGMVVFRLYVAGERSNSVCAIANIQDICGRHLPDRHRLEIVDVFVEPQRALDDGVLVTPTLVRITPPEVRILGNLNDRSKVLQALGLASEGTIDHR